MDLGITAVKEMLTKHYFNVEVAGYEAWPTSFVCADDDDYFVVFAKGIERLVLGCGNVCCWWVMGGEVVSFVDEAVVDGGDYIFWVDGIQ